MRHRAQSGVYCRPLSRLRALRAGYLVADAAERAGQAGDRATLVRGDACDFDGAALFGGQGFDRVVLSYSLSMIPDWQAALRMAAVQLAPGGELHVLDFGNQTRLPRSFRRLLQAWLARFHVTPRVDLHAQMQEIAASHNLKLRFQPLYRDYARYGVLMRSAQAT